MPRYFAPISIADFQTKLFNAIKKHPDFDDVEVYGIDGVTRKKGDDIQKWDDFKRGCGPGSSVTPFTDEDVLIILKNLSPTVDKDIKVQFDTENIRDDWNSDGEPPHGFHTLDNGLTLFGMSAGGDWENPVYFILYWDGMQIRAYVPTEGNLWNTDTKTAYGNDEEGDIKNVVKRFPDLQKTETHVHQPDGTIWKSEPHYQLEGLRNDGEAIVADIKKRILPASSRPKK